MAGERTLASNGDPIAGFSPLKRDGQQRKPVMRTCGFPKHFDLTRSCLESLQLSQIALWAAKAGQRHSCLHLRKTVVAAIVPPRGKPHLATVYGGVVGQAPFVWQGSNAPWHNPALPSDNRAGVPISHGIRLATYCIECANAASKI